MSVRNALKPFLLMSTFLLPGVTVSTAWLPTQLEKKNRICYKSCFLQTKLFIFFPEFHVYGELQIPKLHLLEEDSFHNHLSLL